MIRPNLLFVLLNTLRNSLLSYSKCEEGRVELDYNYNKDNPPVMLCTGGEWDYIRFCSSYGCSAAAWSVTEAAVMCSQLGYRIASANGSRGHIQTALPCVNLSVRMAFSCTGLEKRLIDCAHFEYDCNCLSCLGVYATACNTSTTISCTAGDVERLNDSTVLVCAKGEWHALCSDQNTWTAAQAKVACRQLGMSPNGASPNNVFSLQRYPMLNVIMHCGGNETGLLECSSTKKDCTTNQTVAGLICGDPTYPSGKIMIFFENQMMIKISWNYDSYSNAVFRITCSIDQITFSKTVNETNEIMIGNFQLLPDTTNPPRKIMISFKIGMIKISWNYDSYSNAVFRITCSIDQITFSKTVTETNETVIEHFQLLPGTELQCCVIAVTSNGESESICNNTERIMRVPSEAGPSSITGDHDNLSTFENIFIHSSKARYSSSSVTDLPEAGPSSITGDHNSLSTFESIFIHSSKARYSSSSITGQPIPVATAGSSATSSPVPWVVGLVIGIVIGAVIIMIVWIGQVIVCRKIRNHSKLLSKARVHKEVENPLYTYSSQQATSPTASATEPHYTMRAQARLSSEPMYTNTDKDNIYSIATSSDVNRSSTNKGEANYEYCVPSSSPK